MSTTLILAAAAACLGPVYAADRADPKRPNVVVILTDDQGFGELGVTGNPVIRTPHIDRLAGKSVWLTNFHVMPVCSPTRACLMTGRYNYRTGVTDTYIGRSLMHPDETTLAEMLAAGGYRTGIFGKWHLGDNYPMRAMDKGFQQSLVLNGGGLAQPGDSPDPVDERGAYFNATLRRNGTWVKTKGYVSDAITDAAIEFIERDRDRPFFVYLPFNCPHDPHQVPDEYRRRYQGKDFSAAAFPKHAAGHPMAARNNPEVLARVYGMIENIDDNVGRLLAKLDQWKLADNTIVIYSSDNGCQGHNGYNAGFQGWKGTTFEGGIHQFCFVRWPAQLQAGRRVDRIAAHIDLTPTLLELCGVPKPGRVKFDGLSLAPLLRGASVAWPDRTLFCQWHRGDAPERYRSFAARSQDWKLVQPFGAGEKWNGKTAFKLYDMAHDPLELHDVASQHPDRVAKLKAAYDAWFNDVTGARDYAVPSRIFLGTPHEDPVLLTRQDWRGGGANWGPKGAGYWEVHVAASARYDIKLRFDPLKTDGAATLTCGSVSARRAVKAGQSECVFQAVELPVGPGRLAAGLVQGTAAAVVKYVEMNRKPAGSKVVGHATSRVREKIDRGVVAVRTGPTTVYVGWRLLDNDPPGAAFNVYRRIGNARPEKVNAEPIRKTTDFVDSTAAAGHCVAYSVRLVDGEKEGPPSPEVQAAISPGKAACLKIPLENKTATVQKIGIGDLDGDGRYDFVVKTPKDNIDPYEKYWSRSPDTYKLEAYRHDGKLLWRYDLGWAIERGIWYSPYLVYDFDGDGRAEVAVKTGEGDPRDADGRVQKGPEHLTILDGRTGKPITRVDWPPRDPFLTYNYASRNQLCVAYLDGKTPCLLVERGTYTAIILVAYEFHGGKLRELWRWDNRNEPRTYRGQGAHWMHAADVDGDGRDEVAIGSAMIDDDGTALWCTGLGHPDHFYLGKIDPGRPGLQIYCGIEPRNKRNTMCLVDARTGKILWGHDQPTIHIHASGLCSDIDPAHTGSECYSGERDFKDKRWLRTAQGKVIGTKDIGGLSPRSAYWDADRQRELVLGSRISKYGASEPLTRIEGDLVAVADILGDWREEIITSVPGELRIYTTTIPAEDRRACLMQDPIYRIDVAAAAMGYYQVPMTSYDLATGKR